MPSVWILIEPYLFGVIVLKHHLGSYKLQRGYERKIENKPHF